MNKTLDILLASEIRGPETKEYKIKRLSSKDEPVIFTLKAISYNRFAELDNAPSGDFSVHVILAGVVEPNFKEQKLLDKYGANTPAELIKKLLLPGEIAAIAQAIERLSGFNTVTIEEIKKK